MEKIDIVYTWCDISDKNFREKKEKLAQKENIEYQANENCRYENNDELKYSLRSLERNIPWINNIFIVTNEQIPSWLNINHPKIKIVDHKDIFPKNALPCFNSIAIEHCIVNIPNLSEYFLYANDDMFFFKQITPEFFFINNKPICRYDKKLIHTLKDGFYSSFIKKSKTLICQKFNTTIENHTHHNIDAYRKTIILDCQKEFSEEINNTIFSHFRKSENVERCIYNDYAVLSKQGIFKIVTKFRAKTFFIEKLFRMLFKKYQKDSLYIGMNNQDYKKLFSKYNPILFCINDNEITTQIDRQRAKDFLEKLFPKKSAFEL